MARDDDVELSGDLTFVHPERAPAGLRARTNKNAFHYMATMHLHEHLDTKHVSGFRGLRYRVGRWVESKPVQIMLLILLLLDVGILFAELIIEGQCIEEDETLELVEEILFWISFSILVVFAIEIVLLLFAYLQKFFVHLFYVFDLIVISVSIAIELVFRNAEENAIAAELIILSRLWRLVRIFHAFYAEGEAFVHHETHALEKEIEYLKSELKKAKAKSK